MEGGRGRGIPSVSRKAAMALITILFYSLILTSLSLLVLTLLSRKQQEILRVRNNIQAENMAQSGMEIYLHRWKLDGTPPLGFKIDLHKGLTSDVQVSIGTSTMRIVATGKVQRGRFSYTKRLTRVYKLAGGS